MRLIRNLTLLSATLMVSSCDLFGTPSANIPSVELRKKWRECNYISTPSRIKVLACENYERECERRKNKGDFVCY